MSQKTKLVMAATLSVIIVFYISLHIERSETPSGPVAPYATTGWEKRASEWTALTAALYWEGADDESQEGLWAIAWQIRNRVASRDFPRDDAAPDTIRGVVTDGYKRGRGLCQYSFACNGAGESPKEYCRLQNRMRKKEGRPRLSLPYCERRWARYSEIAAKFLDDPGKDPTMGANHYWAAYVDETKFEWMKRDIVSESIIRIGSHKFGWSRNLGEDVPRIVATR